MFRVGGSSKLHIRPFSLRTIQIDPALCHENNFAEPEELLKEKNLKNLLCCQLKEAQACCSLKNRLCDFFLF